VINSCFKQLWFSSLKPGKTMLLCVYSLNEIKLLALIRTQQERFLQSRIGFYPQLSIILIKKELFLLRKFSFFDENIFKTWKVVRSFLICIIEMDTTHFRRYLLSFWIGIIFQYLDFVSHKVKLSNLVGTTTNFPSRIQVKSRGSFFRMYMFYCSIIGSFMTLKTAIGSWSSGLTHKNLIHLAKSNSDRHWS